VYTVRGSTGVHPLSGFAAIILDLAGKHAILRLDVMGEETEQLRFTTTCAIQPTGEVSCGRPQSAG
jgi:hypothetical protein